MFTILVILASFVFGSAAAYADTISASCSADEINVEVTIDVKTKQGTAVFTGPGLKDDLGNGIAEQISNNGVAAIDAGGFRPSAELSFQDGGNIIITTEDVYHGPWTCKFKNVHSQAYAEDESADVYGL